MKKANTCPVQVIVTVNDLFLKDDTLGASILFRAGVQDRYQIIRGGLAVSAITDIVKLKSLEDTVIDPASERKILQIAKWADENVDRSIVEAMLNKRTQLVLLINSGGGKVLPAECIVSLMERIKLNGGKVITCTSSNAGSAAMQIFGGASAVSYSHAEHSELSDYFPGLPDERISLTDTCFLEHESYGGDDPSNDVQSCLTTHQRTHIQTISEAGDATARELIKSLLQHTVECIHVEGVIRKIEAARKDVHNLLSNAYFLGSELPGFVTSYASSIAEMRDIVEKMTGTCIDLHEWKKSPVARFFLFSLIEEKLRTMGYRDAAVIVCSSNQIKIVNIPKTDSAKIAETVGEWIRLESIPSRKNLTLSPSSPHTLPV